MSPACRGPVTEPARSAGTPWPQPLLLQGIFPDQSCSGRQGLGIRPLLVDARDLGTLKKNSPQLQLDMKFLDDLTVEDVLGGDPLEAATSALHRKVDENYRSLRKALGTDIVANLRRQGIDLRNDAKTWCPVEDNTHVRISSDGIPFLVVQGEREGGGRGIAINSPFFLEIFASDAFPDTRRLMIESVADQFARIMSSLMKSAGEARKADTITGLAVCLANSLHDGRPLTALGYSLVIAEEGDPLAAELAGLIYGSGSLTYRDFYKAQTYLERAERNASDDEDLARVRRVLDLIDRYRKAGGTNEPR